MMKKVSGRFGGLAKGVLLCALLPSLGVYADPWEAWSGHIHTEYNGPWHWEESNVKQVAQGNDRIITCDATITGYTGNQTDLVIPEKITFAPYFEGDGISIHIIYEATVRRIGAGAFGGKRDLISVTIPNTVVEIGDGYWADGYPHGAFAGCENLNEVIIGNNVTNIGLGAFSSCSSLRNITFPRALKHIGGGAFYWCRGLTSVTIPDSVMSIEYGVFSYCSGLTSVTIPDSVTSIGGGGVLWLQRSYERDDPG